MKIAAFQAHAEPAAVTANIARLAAAAARAADEGARLLVAPELFLSGYHIGHAATRRLAEAANGPSAQALAAVARRTGVALLYGYAERAGEAVFNAAQLIGRDGLPLANHRKTHLFGDLDRTRFAAGSTLPTLARVDGLQVGVLICYEAEFPENVRLLALAGADLVAVPTALMQPYAFVARTLVPARAFENQLFIAYVNHCGAEGELTYVGESSIVAPDGVELARAGTEEALLIAELDGARQARSRLANPYLDDRRPALYGAIGAAATDADAGGRRP